MRSWRQPGRSPGSFLTKVEMVMESEKRERLIRSQDRGAPLDPGRSAFAVIFFPAFLVIWSWPNVYRSTATVLVERSRSRRIWSNPR